MAEATTSSLIENLAEATTSSLIENLRQLFLSGTLWSLKKQRWTEFDYIIDQLQSIDAMSHYQLPGDDLVERTRSVIRRTEDLFQTYMERSYQSITCPIYKRPIYWAEKRGFVKKLGIIKDEINQVGLCWRSAHVDCPRPIEVLPRSRENVPFHLRQCIYYFLLFPVDLEVPTRRLIALWVAEGLIQSKTNENEPVEHTAEHYLDELIDLGLVRITKKKLNGKVKACQLNDDDGSTRGTWLDKAIEARFFQDANECTTRLVDNHGADENNHPPSFIQVNTHVPISSSPNYRNVISFLSFDPREGSKPGEDIGYFLNKCILAGFFLWLRVLDLERVFRPKLPKAITKLTLLRYLGLRWTYLEDLPEYVSMLFNLQVLDVKHTYITVLPKSIWSMPYLRHLYLSETYRTRFDDPPSENRIYLDEIQTLWGAFIDEHSSVKRGLDTLLSLRKLGLSCRSVSEKQLQAVARWISKLELLETLRLKSRDERGRACDLHLESLETNSKLSTVYLLGKLITPSIVATFPDTLVEVTLSGSELNGKDPMECLGKLKNLIVLRLLSGSVMLSVICCSGGSFPKLKAFKIWELPNLEEWDAEEGAMPCLELLEIRCCKSLKMVPRALQHVDTLREFMLTRMPEKFIDESKTMRPTVWSKVEDVLEVVEQQPE